MIGTNLELIECIFPDTTIKKGVLHGRVEGSAQVRSQRTVNEIHDNDFSQAELDDVDFRGDVDLTKQKLPTSEEYLFVRDTCKASVIVKDLQSSIVEKDELKRSQTLAGLLDFFVRVDRERNCCVLRSGEHLSGNLSLASLDASIVRASERPSRALLRLRGARAALRAAPLHATQ